MKKVTKLTVVVTKEYYFYQLQTKVYETFFSWLTLYIQELSSVWISV